MIGWLLSEAIAASPLWVGPLVVRPCEAVPAALPAALEQVFQAVVVVDSPDDIGSGVMISPDGFVLTAAHVVGDAPTVELRFRSGISLPATVVRVDEAEDVALVRVPGTGHACLPIAAPPPVGSDLYVVGSPIAAGLEFSVSKGIVGRIRDVDGLHLIQTDATINSGNSGGPMVDPSGRLVGVVTAKLVGEHIEGIGFGVPAHRAVRVSLELVEGSQSSDLQPALVGRRHPTSQVGGPEPYVPLVRHGGDPPQTLMAGAVVAAVGWVVLGSSIALDVADGPSHRWRAGQLVGGAAGLGGSVVIGLSVR